MKVFIISETLMAGGAEWFTLRLWQSLKAAGHEVLFFVLRPDMIDKRLTDSFPDFQYISLPLKKVKQSLFVDKFLSRINPHLSLTERWNTELIKEHIDKHQPDVLHSHLLKTDAVVHAANKEARIRHITTVHGDYIQAIRKNKTFLLQKMERLLPVLDNIVLISDEQLQILGDRFPGYRKKLVKIYNGYPEPNDIEISPHDTFNFGLVARGIPEKGWEPAIRAFLQLNAPDTRLLLFGESPYLNQLKQQYKDDRIVFAGFTGNPVKAVQQMDVGLLPTWYASESLPTTVIEYLLLKKPLIATNAGEIANMITNEANGQKAGILLNTKDPAAMVAPLKEAMQKLYKDREYYNRLQNSCSGAFSKFSMQKCIDLYTKLYKAEKALNKEEVSA